MNEPSSSGDDHPRAESDTAPATTSSEPPEQVDTNDDESPPPKPYDGYEPV